MVLIFCAKTSFSSIHFVCVNVVQRYRSTNSTTDWKIFCFIFSDQSDFHMVDNLSTSFHTFDRRLFMLLSVDEILLMKYVKWSTNFNGLSLRWESYKNASYYFERIEEEHLVKQQMYSQLLHISQTIQLRQTRLSEHCWRSKDELKRNDDLLWT